MKKIIIVAIIIVAILAIGSGIWIYLNIQENKRIDAEAVTLKSDMKVEFGKETKVSDFIENLNRKYD